MSTKDWLLLLLILCIHVNKIMLVDHCNAVERFSFPSHFNELDLQEKL
jgi:hypothetical protein